jgi:hypothetical protein
VKVRGGWFLGNSSGDGIAIQNPKGASGTSVATIDLGTNADPGDNTLQAPTGGVINKGAGICLDIAANADQQLAASGNVFGGTTTPIDCAATGTYVLHVATGLGCTGHVDVGGNIGAFPESAGADSGAGADASADANADAGADASADSGVDLANTINVGAACSY